MKKKKIIRIDTHALLRLLHRGEAFGLNFEESHERAFITILQDVLSKRKHLSKDHRNYYHYFNDNLSFYVICEEIDEFHQIKCTIKTVIIERGRE